MEVQLLTLESIFNKIRLTLVFVLGTGAEYEQEMRVVHRILTNLVSKS